MISDSGGAAFPAHEQINDNGDTLVWPAQGMSLRAYFAGRALPACLIEAWNGDDRPTADYAPLAARMAVAAADALIAELTK